MSVALKNAGSGYAVTTYALAPNTNPSSIAIGNLDGSGRPDLATSNASTGTVSKLLANASGGYDVSTAADGRRRPLSIALGDLDNDGDNELATANSQTNSVSVLTNSGAGTFSAQRRGHDRHAPLRDRHERSQRRRQAAIS